MNITHDELVEAISARLHVTTDRIPGAYVPETGLSADTSAVHESAHAVMDLLEGRSATSSSPGVLGDLGPEIWGLTDLLNRIRRNGDEVPQDCIDGALGHVRTARVAYLAPFAAAESIDE